jgi:hypothetical protein
MWEERRLKGFKNTVLRDEVTAQWRKIHNKVLCDLYSSPNVIRVIKSSTMRWARHVARMEEEKFMQGFDRET